MTELKVGFHPYTFVRANVMRSLLLKKEDYRKLVKMSVAEITKYLQDKHYKKEINELGGVHTSSELIETAMSRNLERSFMKLRRICQGNLSLLVDAYLKRYDIENVKVVLRAIKTEQEKEEAEALISDAGTHPAEMYRQALSLDFDEALSKLSTTGLMEFDKKGLSMTEIETELDREYYDSLLELADRLPSYYKFRNFILMEIEIVNILTLLRLKRSDVPVDRIMDLMLIPSRKDKRILSRMINAEGTEGVMKALKKTSYKDVAEKGLEDYKKTGSLVGIERELKKKLLRQSVLFLHQNILSINVILGYMFAKEIEVRNLRLLVKGKKLGLDNEYIRREIVV